MITHEERDQTNTMTKANAEAQKQPKKHAVTTVRNRKMLNNKNTSNAGPPGHTATRNDLLKGKENYKHAKDNTMEHVSASKEKERFSKRKQKQSKNRDYNTATKIKKYARRIWK